MSDSRAFNWFPIRTGSRRAGERSSASWGAKTQDSDCYLCLQCPMPATVLWCDRFHANRFAALQNGDLVTSVFVILISQYVQFHSIKNNLFAVEHANWESRLSGVMSSLTDHFAAKPSVGMGEVGDGCRCRIAATYHNCQPAHVYVIIYTRSCYYGVLCLLWGRLTGSWCLPIATRLQCFKPLLRFTESVYCPKNKEEFKESIV